MLVHAQKIQNCELKSFYSRGSKKQRQQHSRLREKRLHVHMKVTVVGVNICYILQMAFHFLTPLQNVVMSNAWMPCGSEIPLNERAWKKS